MNKFKVSKDKSILIFFAVIALVVSGCLYFLLIGNMEDVITINQTVRGGTQVTENMITIKKLDKSSLPDGYISAKNVDKVKGQYLDLGLTAGGVITEANLSKSGKSSLIPTGYILYSIKDLETYPQGLMTGDNLNIIISTNLADRGKAVLTFQDIEVKNITYDAEKAINSIELQITPEQAQYIAYGQANGQISLSLLPPNYESKPLDVLDENSFQNGAVVTQPKPEMPTTSETITQ